MDILPEATNGSVEQSNIYRCKKNTNGMYLDVIAVISNPARFTRRYTLFEEFCERMRKEPQVRLLTIELQQRARDFATSATLKFTTKHELWHKENMINVAVAHLPKDWEYVAWIDSDIEFLNKDWVKETIEELQTYNIVQMFSHANDLGPKLETLTTHLGFAYLYVNNIPMNNYKPHCNYRNGHSGYAWAMRKSTYDAVGGIMDFAILGSGDALMAMSFIGNVELAINPKLNKNYIELIRIYQERCELYVKRNIGYVHGTIIHYFHGSKSNRQYKTRNNILIENKFDPLRDVWKDHNGIWQLTDQKPQLRDDIRRYFRMRNEDSIEINEDYTNMKKDWL